MIEKNDILLSDILVLEVCHAVFILVREMGISAHNLRKVPPNFKIDGDIKYILTGYKMLQ